MIQAMTVRQSVRCSKLLAKIVTRVLPKKLTRYHVVEENLRTAFGADLPDDAVDRIVLGMWEHLFRMIAEIAQAPRKLCRENVYDFVEVPQSVWCVRTMASGRPVILLSGHYGNWEIGNCTFGLFGFSMGAVARDLDNPYLHDWFARIRKLTRHHLISKTGGSAEMIEYMRHHGTIGLLGDQDAGRKGLFVDFFGKPASTFKSIALMAMEYEALILVGYTRRLEDDFDRHSWARFEMGVADVIDPRKFQGADAVEQITQAYTAALEQAIRLAPEQYFWLHRRWKSVPSTKRRGRSKTLPKAA
jgi:Kdo2-lipid IVA lauroyltransferase/acyltransferase